MLRFWDIFLFLADSLTFRLDMWFEWPMPLAELIYEGCWNIAGGKGEEMIRNYDKMEERYNAMFEFLMEQVAKMLVSRYR